MKRMHCVIPTLTRKFNPDAFPAPDPYHSFETQEYDYYEDPDEFNSIGNFIVIHLKVTNFILVHCPQCLAL